MGCTHSSSIEPSDVFVPSPAVDVKRTVPAQDAAYPFDRDSATSADITLCSADDTLFRVSTHVLSTASPVFRDMLSLGPPPAYAATGPRVQVASATIAEEKTLDGLPVFRVAEDAATLDVLLRWCYPVARPPLREPDNLQRLVAATQRYAVHAFDDVIKDALEAHLRSDPITVLGIAVPNHLSDWARRAILAIPMSSLISLEVPALTDRTLVAFIRYHTSCAFAAAAVTAQRGTFRHTIGFTARKGVRLGCKHCSCDDPRTFPDNAEWIAPRYLWTFLNEAERALLIHPHKDAFVSRCKVAKCGTCDYSLEQERGLREFMERLVSAVDAAIEQVPVPEFW
ncbi:hypothetical protein FA95DRAFT_633371 [Auriscalpium vulgare]|uniref:Uncharacterized protein n=1 Tax=Auriscalpium vulgare TaxID=40419 RepID=A0ACB8RDH2_9AGAM|nr:hypothetical protein FA95DRAFT_633371 [Auriscalpium vulgare]